MHEKPRIDENVSVGLKKLEISKVVKVGLKKRSLSQPTLLPQADLSGAGGLSLQTLLFFFCVKHEH